MKLVVFGLAISSSWGNGHATLWRGLCRALARRGHQVTFFERDVPYYAKHRDLHHLEHGRLVLYAAFEDVRREAEREVGASDVAMVTSYCPDAGAAERIVLGAARPLRVFYDLDTGVTLDNHRSGAGVPYLGPNRLAGYDLVLSYTGGAALDALREELGARRVATLYGSVDPEVHRPVPPVPEFASDLCYLATHAADRYAAVLELIAEPARRLTDRTFLIGGPKYPLDFPWRENIRYIEHVKPELHGAFYCSGRFTLNLTRAAMARYGYCPSGRLFEAAAVGAPILTDAWVGLEAFFEPGSEVAVVGSADDVIAALGMSEEERLRMARRAWERTMAEHTSDRRAEQLEAALDGAYAEVRDVERQEA